MKKKKICIYTTIVVLLCVSAFICNKRWGAWFGNPEEPIYSSLNKPGRIQLTLGNNGMYSRNISWQCGDSLSSSFVYLTQENTADTSKIEAKRKMFHTPGGVTTIHYTQLDNLNVGKYFYNVTTGNNSSEWYSFNVKRDSLAFSFVYLGDIQDTVNGVTKEFITSIRQNNPAADFWILGGDVVERPHDQYWNEYFNSMDSLTPSIPFIACAGNHEYLKGVTRNLEERFIYTFSYFVNSRQSGNAVYDTRYGDTAFFLLDSNRDWWNFFSQRSWLKEALERNKDAKWKVVILHHPIYSIRGKMNNILVRQAFNSLIKEYQVDLVLQGHEHGYARMITKKDNDPDQLTTPIYLISQFSPKDYRLYFNEKYDRFGNGFKLYQTVNINKDTLSILSFTEDNELYDQISVIKKDNQAPEVLDIAKKWPEHITINSDRIHLKPKKEEKYRKDMEQHLLDHKFSE